MIPSYQGVADSPLKGMMLDCQFFPFLGRDNCPCLSWVVFVVGFLALL